MPHEIDTTACGLPVAIELMALFIVTFGLLVSALLGLIATQMSPPCLGTAKFFAAVSMLGGCATAVWVWRLAGVSLLFAIPALPIVFGGLAFAAVR